MTEGVVQNLVSKADTVTREAVHAAGEKGTYLAVNNGAIAGGVGLGAAVSAIVAQMEYRAKKRDMRNLLRQELAASQGKKSDDVASQDIDRLAADNGVVAEQIQKNKKERNVSIGAIFVATMATVAVISLMAGPLGMFAGIAQFGLAAEMGAKLVASVIAFGIVRKPVTRIAEKIFGLEERTAFERIASIAKDREDDRKITKERVMSVFVSANPLIDQYITATYGDKFDKLKVADKETIIQTIGEKLGVSQITDDINTGRIRATELTFKVEGKASGVLPTAGEKPKHTVLMTIKERLHQVAEHMPGHHTEQPPRSFAERVARVPVEQIGHVQRLNDARAAEAAAATQR